MMLHFLHSSFIIVWPHNLALVNKCCIKLLFLRQGPHCVSQAGLELMLSYLIFLSIGSEAQITVPSFISVLMSYLSS